MKLRLSAGDIHLEDGEVYSLLAGIAQNTAMVAATVLADHAMGIPQLVGNARTYLLPLGSEEARAMVAATESSTLDQLFGHLQGLATALADHDEKVAQWVGRHLGLEGPKDSMSSDRLRDAIEDELAKNAGLSALPWIGEPSYAMLLSESQSILAKIEHLAKQTSDEIGKVHS